MAFTQSELSVLELMISKTRVSTMDLISMYKEKKERPENKDKKEWAENYILKLQSDLSNLDSIDVKLRSMTGSKY